MRLCNLKMVWLGALAIGLATAWGHPAAAADAVNIGVIDEDKLDAKYDKFRQAQEALDKRAQDVEEKLASRIWLNDTDAKRFDEIIMKDKTTDAEDKEMTRFVTLGQNTNAEYLGLAGKVNPTDADTARLKTLKDTSLINQPVVQRLENKLLDKIKQDQEKTFDDFMKIVDGVMADVAKEKNLSIILRKRALIWSAPALDITDAVLAKLNAPGH